MLERAVACSLSDNALGRRGFEPARELAGRPEDLRFHDLRHAFASMAAAKDVRSIDALTA
jgi:integrase